jgi:hypothetical protein
MRRIQVKTPILLGMAFLTPWAGWAVDPMPMDVKLGLWESTVSTQIAGMPALPPELLAKMTPEQRAKMEAAMQGRGGGGARTNSTKHCVTKETLSQMLSFGDNRAQNCKKTLVSSTGTKQVVHMECTTATTLSTGDLQFEAVNRETIKGSMVMNAGPGGRGMSSKMEFTSKWLSSDCGEIGQKKN